jgi:hypothetical protein
VDTNVSKELMVSIFRRGKKYATPKRWKLRIDMHGVMNAKKKLGTGMRFEICRDR